MHNTSNMQISLSLESSISEGYLPGRCIAEPQWSCPCLPWWPRCPCSRSRRRALLRSSQALAPALRSPRGRAAAASPSPQGQGSGDGAQPPGPALQNPPLWAQATRFKDETFTLQTFLFPRCTTFWGGVSSMGDWCYIMIEKWKTW